MFIQPSSDVRPRLGISACLLGRKVRFDGGHKRSHFLATELAPLVEWVPVCPEVELGLGTPRPSLRLIGDPQTPRLVESKSDADRTEAMEAFVAARVKRLAAARLDGFVLKKDSPSCGLHRVKVWNDSGQAERTGRGLFAHRLAEAMPHLPVEEEGRLNDTRLRANFLVRVFTRSRLARLFATEWTQRDLIEFHTDHKLLVLAANPRAAKSLGRLVASAGALDREELSDRYTAEMMDALSRVSTTGTVVNALQHMVGYVTKLLDRESRREMHDLIDGFGRGELPLAVPLALLRHHARRADVPYLRRQRFAEPCPPALRLHAAL